MRYRIVEDFRRTPMSRSSAEILDASRKEIARGRPRAALRELALARAELLANADLDGMKELLELARAIRTLAPSDSKAKETLLATTEAGIEALAPGVAVELAATSPVSTTSAQPRASFTAHGLVSTGQVFAPARAEIERLNTGRSLRLLEKARRELLTRADVDGLGELLELAQRIPVSKPHHAALQRRLLEAAQQNVRYLSRRRAIEAGEAWSDPFAAGKPKTRLPSLPPMSRRDKLIAAAIVVALVAGITALALVNRASQRTTHAIKCPTGEQGGQT